jgi:mannose-6-phosphate isomerase-like protein (cupin superfamily)
MSTATSFLRRDPADLQTWAETCGQIRCLIEEKDGAAGAVHYVEIQDAKLRSHERTDEFYHVLDGRGTMVLKGEVIELHQGVVVYVPRGVKHKAQGNPTVLTVCIPRGVLGDVHELEERAGRLLAAAGPLRPRAGPPCSRVRPGALLELPAAPALTGPAPRTPILKG